MRLLIASTILIALALGCSTPEESHSEMKKQTIRRAPAETDLKNIMAQKTELRRLHQELRSRAIIRNLGDRINRIDPVFLEAKMGVKMMPDFERLSDREIQLKIKDLEEKASWEAMTYGNNDLRDIYVTPPESVDPLVPYVRDEGMLTAARSVVAIVDGEYLKPQIDGTYTLITEPLQEMGGSPLCSFSDFYNAEHTKIAGTGFLIADTIIATAGHVYDNYQNIVEDFYFVFDYKMLTPWKPRTQYTDQDVYRAKTLINRMNIDGNDWALFLLDRPVEGRDPLEYRKSGRIDREAKLYLLGHPFGLPMKCSGIGRVLNNIPCHFFTSNIDNYEYNSGSPVFDRSTNLVEGILCRDLGPDEEQLCGCVAPAIFRTQYGIPGVEITRSFMFASYLQRPDSVLVRCTIPAADVRVDNEMFPFEMGEEKLVPYSDILGMQLLIAGLTDCWAPYKPNRGDVWEIRYGPDEEIVMVKVCE